MTTSLVPSEPTTASATPSEHAAPAVLARTTAVIASHLEAAIDRLDPSLHAAVHHHFSGGGKRVRAALVLLCAAAVGGSDADAVPGAVAVELVHNYSLLHDDIIDGDRERRHRPAVWAQFGEGVAIVAGDALAALATQLLLERPTASHVEAARLLADANQKMIAGQSADMAFENRDTVGVEECLAMERGKTGALLAASCAIGAVLGGGGPTDVQALTRYGEHLGAAFQAIDDVLGIWGEPTITGKPVGADLIAKKKTLPVAITLDEGGPVAHELRALLASDPGPEVVRRATQLMEDFGARERATRIADQHLGESLRALQAAALLAGPVEDLVSVARFVTTRDR